MHGEGPRMTEHPGLEELMIERPLSHGGRGQSWIRTPRQSGVRSMQTLCISASYAVPFSCRPIRHAAEAAVYLRSGSQFAHIPDST